MACDVLDVMAEALRAPEDRLPVQVTKVDSDLWAFEGVPASEKQRTA